MLLFSARYSSHRLAGSSCRCPSSSGRLLHSSVIEEAFQLKTLPSGVQRLKRPENAFTRFLKDRFGSKYSPKDMGEGGRMWREMNDAERQSYQDAFNADMTEYRRRAKQEIYCTCPTPPLAIYFRFLRDQKAPGSQCHAKWAAMTEAEKQPYCDAYNADLVIYRRRKMEWTQGLMQGSLDDIQNMKGKRDKNPSLNQLGHYIARFKKTYESPELGMIDSLPPRSQSPFQRFQTARGIPRNIAKVQWKMMTDEEKQPFKELYVQGCEHRRQALATAPWREFRALSAVRRARQPKPASKLPLSSYFRFYQEWAKSRSEAGLPTGKPGVLAGQAWRQLTDEERAPYIDAYAKAKAEYLASQQSTAAQS
ncbi:hypothetical protein EIP91_000382 [Steccherinum ochraceum]|uniref:HMG box domain-containing protein n=1 Tax=Steccherinum ochraceum TaxID=92696 RepID=A0A4R0RIB4_9APHY|nr:hypothetical protein EIP91_000382 [Steccherinum ochraceum]